MTVGPWNIGQQQGRESHASIGFATRTPRLPSAALGLLWWLFSSPQNTPTLSAPVMLTTTTTNYMAEQIQTLIAAAESEPSVSSRVVRAVTRLRRPSRGGSFPAGRMGGTRVHNVGTRVDTVDATTAKQHIQARHVCALHHTVSMATVFKWLFSLTW